MKKLFTLVCLAVAGIVHTYGQCDEGESQVTMTIVTDRYGQETTWTVTGPGGSPSYASGGPYTQASSNGAYPKPPVNFCVPDGSILSITVNDSFGDGMCCSYGQGGWTLTIAGQDVASGGTFTSVETASAAVGTDLGISTLGLADVITQGSQNISGTVRNNGITPIASFTLSYAIDGGEPSEHSLPAPGPVPG